MKKFFLIICALIIGAFFSTHISAHEKQLKNIVFRNFKSVCSTHVPGARCHAKVATIDSSNNPLNTTNTPISSSYGPVQFHTAYNLPCTPGGNVGSTCSQPTSFGGQTIAIIDAYNDPTIENDLGVFDSNYGLPSCTRANGCLTVVNQNGGSSLPSTVDGGWALETSLDVEVVHEICQTCKILLVEAYNSNFLDLGVAVNTAVNLGATEISNSYGASEWNGETSYDTYYNHPGIAITASSGDSGYGSEYPAASSFVTATGGTTLQINTDNTYGNEIVWNGTGSGCSNFETANSWQLSLSNWNLTGCGNSRAISDVAADADPNTGAAVYDSTPYLGSTGWYQVGGTSLSSPIISAAYALAGGVSQGTNASSIPYLKFNSTNSHDITSGSNGFCGTIMCNAGVGYDGPTGMGSPNGILGFSSNTPVVTPTLTPSPTSTPTLIPSPTPTLTPTPTPPTEDTFGYTSIGNYTDIFDNNYIDGSKYKMGPQNGTLKSITVYVQNVQSYPHNLFQVAIYSDNNGQPGNLIAKSGSKTLKAYSWNTLFISVPLFANRYYWLVYNTNSSNYNLNELKFSTVSGNIGVYSAYPVSFGVWPQTFFPILDNYEYSIYATYSIP